MGDKSALAAFKRFKDGPRILGQEAFRRAVIKGLYVFHGLPLGACQGLTTRPG